MPVLALVGLIFTILKVALQVIEYLKEHPEIKQEVRDVLTRAGAHLETVQDDLRVEYPRRDVEAP